MRGLSPVCLMIAAACTTGDLDELPPEPGTLAEGEVFAQLFESGVAACADAPRSEQPFDLRTLPEQPMNQYNLTGGGVLVEDLDADGWFDLFLPSERAAQLFFGERGDFSPAHGQLGGLALDDSVGATAVDYDADGDLDVLVTRWARPNTLLRNDGNRTFVDVTEQAFGPNAPAWRTQSASWADVDGDGDLDLFAGSYGEWTVLDVLDPEPDCSDHQPDPAELWLNDGDGTFTDVSDQLPVEVHDGYSFMSGFYDIDGDGLPELFSAHDDGLCQQSLVARNVGGRFQVDDGLLADFNTLSHDMGMGVADLNGDEQPDFLLTTWNGLKYMQSSRRADGSVFWVDYAGTVGLTVDHAPPEAPARAQPGQQVYGWGAEFGDVDNDGDLDAAMVFGFWSVFDGAGDPRSQNDGLWIREGGSFTDEGASYGLAEPGISRSVVFADLDNDGFLDVVKRILDGPSPVHVSRCDDRAWLRVRLQQDAPNTFGVGAKVRVTVGGASQIRWITSGSTGMYSGAPLEAHFGLGDADTIDLVEVIWPDGMTSAFEDVPTRQRITAIRQPNR